MTTHSKFRGVGCDNINLAEIQARVWAAITERKPPSPATTDEINLTMLVARLVEEHKAMRSRLKRYDPCYIDTDFCPLCCSVRFSRPHRPSAGFDDEQDWRDYTKRQCSECSEIRPDPEDRNDLGN